MWIKKINDEKAVSIHLNGYYRNAQPYFTCQERRKTRQTGQNPCGLQRVIIQLR